MPYINAAYYGADRLHMANSKTQDSGCPYAAGRMLNLRGGYSIHDTPQGGAPSCVTVSTDLGGGPLSDAAISGDGN